MLSSRPLILAAATALLAVATLAGPLTGAARAEDKVSLFKVVTVKDEIVIGFSDEELGRIGGRDAPAVARALTDKGTLGVWQYAVRKNAGGDLEQAPLRQIGLIANEALRVEPYNSPLKVLPAK